LRRLIVEEPVARSAVWALRLAIFAAATALVAMALSRSRAADPEAALVVFAASLVMAAFSGLLAAAAAAVIWRDGRRGAGRTALAFLLVAAIIAYPAYLTVVAFALPPINDVSTDLKSPPTFLLSAKARQARAGHTPPASSEETRAAQRAAYPDIAPIRVEMDSTEAYQLALSVAGDLGWRVVDSEPPNLGGDGAALIEATDRSLFFGFVDDIAIRIRPGATQTIIDVRSVSRVGRHDFGANAERVRKFAAAVQEDLPER
jgi:uncharacterized protein (DUF1499 family)